MRKVIPAKSIHPLLARRAEKTMAITIDQAAAHEAGHAVVTMAVGVQVTAITGMVGQHTDSFLVGAFETFATEFDIPAYNLLESRLQYLCVVAGIAGELAHEGTVEPQGALDDLTRLRQVNLTNHEILLLSDVAFEIIAENRQVWEQIYNAVLFVSSQGSHKGLDDPRSARVQESLQIPAC